MNELQAYTASIPDSNPNKAELIRQWKIDNKWGQQEVEEVVETPVEEVKTNGAAETDAAVVPTPEASEKLNFGVGKSLFQESEWLKSFKNQQEQRKAYDDQQAKFNSVVSKEETHNADTYDFKWNVGDDGNLE